MQGLTFFYGLRCPLQRVRYFQWLPVFTAGPSLPHFTFTADQNSKYPLAISRYPYTARVLRLTSYVLRLTSYVLRLTSYVLRLNVLSYVLSYVLVLRLTSAVTRTARDNFDTHCKIEI